MYSHQHAGRPNPVDLRRLRYFVAVCEHGGISRAAHALSMAQPALSRQIQLLEKEMGMPLFMRTVRGTEPSVQGLHLLGVAREQLRRLDDAVRDLRERFSAPATQVRLGICPTVAPLFLEYLTALLNQHHPSVVLSVVRAYSGDLQNLLDQNQLDLALTYSSAPLPGHSSIDLLSEKLVLVLGRGLGARGQSPVGLAEVAAMALILPTRAHALRRIVDEIAAARGMAVRPALELDSLEAVRSLLAEPGSTYCTVLPVNCAALGLKGDAFAIADFDDPGMRRTIALVQPRPERGGSDPAPVVEAILRRAAELRKTEEPT